MMWPVLGFLARQPSYDRPLVRDDLDQMLGLELPQRFSNDRPRDVQGLDELSLRQSLARRELPRNDRVTQLFEYLLTQRCRCFPDLR